MGEAALKRLVARPVNGLSWDTPCCDSGPFWATFGPRVVCGCLETASCPEGRPQQHALCSLKSSAGRPSMPENRSTILTPSVLGEQIRAGAPVIFIRPFSSGPPSENRRDPQSHPQSAPAQDAISQYACPTQSGSDHMAPPKTYETHETQKGEAQLFREPTRNYSSKCTAKYKVTVANITTSTVITTAWLLNRSSEGIWAVLH